MANTSILAAFERMWQYVATAIGNKADLEHIHDISEVTDLELSLNLKVPSYRKINGNSLEEDITLTASDIDAYSKDEIDDMELITTDEIDVIWGTQIQVASVNEVTF